MSLVTIFYSQYKQVTLFISAEDHTYGESKISELTLSEIRDTAKNLEMSISMRELSRTVTANCVMNGNQTFKR